MSFQLTHRAKSKAEKVTLKHSQSDMVLSVDREHGGSKLCLLATITLDLLSHRLGKGHIEIATEATKVMLSLLVATIFML